MNTGNKVKRDAIIVLLVVLILGFGYLLYRSRYTALAPTVQTATDSATSTQSLNTNTDNNVSVVGPQLPDGFPTDIPIETGAVVEAYKAFYQRQNATRYVVSFTTTKSKTTEWDLYNSYMNQAGYTLSKIGTSKADGVVSGVKAGDNMSVIVATAGKETSVQIHYWTSN